MLRRGRTILAGRFRLNFGSFSRAGQLCVLVAVLTCIQVCTAPASVANPAVPDQTSELLRSELAAGTAQSRMNVGTEELSVLSLLRRFYSGRAYQLAWSREGALLPQAETLLALLREAEQDGLRAADYHLAHIEVRRIEIRRDQEEERLPQSQPLVELDLLLTDAFLLYGSHLATGRSDPQLQDLTRLSPRNDVDLVQLLQTALATNQIASALHGLQPPYVGYFSLRQALSRYRSLAATGGWPPISSGPPLQQGDQSPRVSMVRRRLAVTGELLPGSPPGQEEVFDAGMTQAAKLFQTRHGIEADGVIGPGTLAALNVSVAACIRQIEVNLERWRWLPHDLDQRTLLVNLANFSLEVVENGKPLLPMRIVVGKRSWGTPVFSARVTALILNPSWTVPRSIAVKEVLPAIRKDPQYLRKNSLKVLQGWGPQTREIDPHTIPWATLSAARFPYRFWQEPGPTNPLGQVKFILPNEFDVYLHDTPSRSLFTKTVRAFSHGCVRVEKPLELAEYVLRDDPQWSGEALRAAIAQGRERLVPLPQPLPIYLLYWTAWVDQDGVLQFRPDIYGRDLRLDEALRQASSLLSAAKEKEKST
jgi:L,D-transpeptidase YcbB